MASDYTLPLAEVTEVPLAEEPTTDKAYRVGDDGQVYRVRVTTAEAISPAPDVAPTVRRLDIEVRPLGPDGSVQTDAAGLYIQAAKTGLTIDREMLASPGFDPAAEIMRVIRHQIYLAELQRANAEATDSYLSSQWGGAA